MGKEDNILRKAGTTNPFSVPDNYFENFTQGLMDKLPEKESMPMTSEPTLWLRIKPWIYMAAMFCGIMLSVRVFVGEPKEETFPITQAEVENIAEEEWEIMVGNTMFDDYDLYEFLTEANTNH